MMDTDRALTLALALGFSLLGIGTLVSRLNPATGYEESIYHATHLLFWFGAISALVIVVCTVLYSTDAKHRFAAVSLGVTSMTTIVALPVIRGYYYTGAGDAMSYWGWAKDIQSGVTSSFDIIYPGIMLISLFIDAITGIGLRHAFLLVPVLFAIVFMVGVPVLVRSVRNTWLLVAIGFLSALLLLPVNQISRAGVFLQPYPTVAALFFLPFVLLSVVYVIDGEPKRGLVLFLVCSFSLLLVHPQQAANFLVLILAVAALGPLVTRLLSIDVRWRSVTVPAALFGVLFWGWSATRPRFESSVSGLVVSILFDNSTTGDVESASGSLEGVGGSIVELFVKLFVVDLLYVFLTAGLIGVLVLSAMRKTALGWPPLQSEFATQLSLGLVPVGFLFVAYMLLSSQYFRHLGFLMVIGTVLGSFCLFQLYDYGIERVSERTVKRIVSIGFILLILVSLPLVHMSPYIYQTNPHVTAEKMAGYETAIDVVGSSEIVTIRDHPRRFGDALHGRDSYSSPPSNQSPDGFADRNLASHYGENKLLIVTEDNRVDEIGVYNEFRFSEEDFAYVDSTRDTSNVYSSGEFDAYYLTTTSTDTV
ncbi:hypothetical protein [Natrialba sp. INN-245]|uniref:hypothetical protein n=1 Tax=Natrialba sp. INN-245 TaxID=2690967 RepID=UPI001312F76F|nr:hypothetical protein [Natrialba sp. INN-245]MWV40046.1 hypothetical protein [Natrialba sp. INN-245]